MGRIEKRRLALPAMIAAWLAILFTATPVLGETKPGRWDKEIEAFLEADRAKAPKKNRTLFILSLIHI